MSIVGLDHVGSKAVETSEPKTSSLGKDDFLQLLVTQLQAQDPLKPMDSTDFTAQLAQFSSLEELQNINNTLGDVGKSQSVLTNSQAVDFIGKRIQAVGDRIHLTSGQTIPIEFDLQGDSTGVFIKVYNQYGDFMRDIDAGAMTAGQQSVTWDGIDYQGRRVPDGSYRFEVMAMDENGNNVPATTFTTGTVSGVYYKNGMSYLLAGNQEVALGDVVQVYQ